MGYKLNKEKFSEKEIAILRNAVDKAEHKRRKKIVDSDIIRNIIKIVETFLKDNHLICYGGTAINNILPIYDQFYNKNVELPDYDFFSSDALNDAKKLADIYYKNGFSEVEAKAGIHYGTYKIFVNFIPVADITQLHSDIFNTLSKDSIKIGGILYASPNFLRMASYLELSRPAGDVSRWEKILKRLILLNKHYPLKVKNCHKSHFKRIFEGSQKSEENIYNVVKNSIIDQGLVFFGGHAIYFYTKYMSKKQRIHRIESPDFDALSENPQHSAEIIREKLKRAGIENVNIVKHDNIGDIISTHYEIKVGKNTVAFIYKTLACHSYNSIIVKSKVLKIATIDTMLSFYLAFLYADKPYYDVHRILCMSEYLFKVQAKNRLEQKGVLRRFSINCYGKQNTLESIRANKAEKFKELKNNKNSLEFQTYFLRYIPSQKNNHLKKSQKTSKLKKFKNPKNTNKSKKSKKLKKNKTKKNKTKNIFNYINYIKSMY